MTPRRTTTTGLATTALAVLIIAAAALPAQAQILNGDFENGGADWNYNGHAGWDNLFIPAGGNPDGAALIASNSPGPAGIGCIIQTFNCGEPGGDTVCEISFDYWLEPDLDNDDPASGIVRVLIDGNEEFVAAGPSGGWQTGSITVPCGVHVIELCLEVVAADRGWRLFFDNVEASCEDTVGADAETWTSVKGLFR